MFVCVTVTWCVYVCVWTEQTDVWVLSSTRASDFNQSSTPSCLWPNWLWTEVPEPRLQTPSIRAFIHQSSAESGLQWRDSGPLGSMKHSAALSASTEAQEQTMLTLFISPSCAFPSVFGTSGHPWPVIPNSEPCLVTIVKQASGITWETTFMCSAGSHKWLLLLVSFPLFLHLFTPLSRVYSPQSQEECRRNLHQCGILQWDKWGNGRSKPFSTILSGWYWRQSEAAVWTVEPATLGEQHEVTRGIICPSALSPGDKISIKPVHGLGKKRSNKYV